MPEAKTDRDYYRELFPPATRIRLVLALVGSVVVSLLETAAILLLVPLIAVLNNEPMDQGALRVLWQIFGEPSREGLLGWLVACMLGAFIVKDVGVVAFKWWLTGFMAEQNVRMSSRMLAYFLHAPYEAFRRRGVPEVLRVTGEVVGSFYNKTVSGIMSVLTEAISCAAVLVALMIVMPWHTLGIIAYFGIVAALYARWVKPRLEYAARRQLETAQYATAVILQSLGGVEEIKIRHAQDHFVGQARQFQRDSALAGRLGSFLMELPKYLLEIMFIIGLGVLIIVSMEDSFLTTIALLAAAAFRLLPSATRLMASLAIVRSGAPARQMLLDELRREDAYRPSRLTEITDERLRLTEAIAVDHVSFGYQDSPGLVLDDVSFTVPAGSSTALVGGSGAGKTTLGNLFLGLFTPTQGRILVDGQDIATDMVRWHNGIGFVPQDVFHLNLPFDENIAFNTPHGEIDQERLWDAIDRAQLRSVIKGLPLGVRTPIGDRAVRLSGGQRQRVGIARALYRNPSFLLLDEATSALDNETEREITETLGSLRGSLTSVIIAHRLSTVRHVDQVVLLEGGRVAAVGTFDELARTNARFSRMVELGKLE